VLLRTALEVRDQTVTSSLCAYWCRWYVDDVF